LNIKSARADRLARDLAALTGETITEAVTVALAERIEQCRRDRPSRRTVLRAIRKRVSVLPVLDARTDEEILGYDQDGLLP